MGFLTPILTGNASLIARIVMVLLIVVSIFMAHQLDANYNFSKGEKSWAKVHPQNIYNGPTTVDQRPPKKMACFPLHIGSFGVGVCHD